MLHADARPRLAAGAREVWNVRLPLAALVGAGVRAPLPPAAAAELPALGLLLARTAAEASHEAELRAAVRARLDPLRDAAASAARGFREELIRRGRGDVAASPDAPVRAQVAAVLEHGLTRAQVRRPRVGFVRVSDEQRAALAAAAGPDGAVPASLVEPLLFGGEPAGERTAVDLLAAAARGPRTLEAACAARHVAPHAKKESLQEIAKVRLNDPKTWPTDPALLHSRVFLHPDSMIKLKHVVRATLRQTRFGPEADPFEIKPSSTMGDDKGQKFVARFVVPLLRHEIGRRQLARVITGPRHVLVVWATGRQRFGLTGTIAANQRDAGKGGKGSVSVIFMDEHGADWKDVPDLTEMPDIGFFHELYHAEMNQQARNDGMTEREARIEENRYRNARGASSHRALP